MFLTAHATVGALIGQSVPNPWIAFVLGVLSHFVVDLIPHGDQNLIAEGTHKQKMVKLLAITAVDLVMLGGLLFFWFTTIPFVYPLSVAAGMFGAMLPDALQGVTIASNDRLLPRFKHLHDQFHVHMHRTFAHAAVPFSVGLPIQIIFWLIVQKWIGV